MPYFKLPYWKFSGSLIIIVALVFGPISQTTRVTARHAGGFSCFLIAALLILSAFKAIFYEFVTDNNKRSKAQKFFPYCHQCLGWTLFILIGYHSLFFLNLFLWPAAKITVSLLITGILATIGFILVMVSGLDINKVLERKLFRSAYSRHLFTIVLLAFLIVLHINI
ncbi:iron reductase [Desulfosporosinus sp. SB140]|uniref:iron reductase n=1 Tax=Desulfosporosinus paludis TaxID=3115649 RepID=UPI00388F5B18